jgi:hypothetical protein
VQLSAEEIQAALDFWKAKGDAAITARQAVRMALGADPKAPGGLAFEGVAATGWLADLLNQLQGGAAFETLDPPAGFRGTLRPYQARGYSWLGFLRRWGFGACLADDMGLGKTITLIALHLHRGAGPTLVVCPASLLGNWEREINRFAPGVPVHRYHGGDRHCPRWTGTWWWRTRHST